MEAPPCCLPLFVWKSELTEVIRFAQCPCTGLYSRRSSRPQPMGSGGDATPCKVTREDRRLYFLMCRVSFKAHSHTAFKDVPPSTQFSRVFRHPHSYWMYCHPHEAHSHTALKDVPPSTQDPRGALGGHATTLSGTVSMNGREQTQELHLSKVPLTLPYFLTSTSETSCWRSYGGRYGYEPTLT